jgi:hypothetical protein
MAIDSLGRYVTPHKSWDHVGNMIPVVEHSEGIRPHGEFRPAAWLPVQFFDKYYEEFFVIMPGKILACDNDGRIVPAQYGLSGATITYTANDVEAGVIDVRTGSALLTAAIGTFDVSAVTAFLGTTGTALAVSSPIGVAPYAFWQWAGDSSDYDDGFNPAGFRQHNHSLQHQVAILCDYVLELPLVPATVSSAEALTEDTNASNVSTMDAVSNLPVAANTLRTPLTFSEGAGAPGDVAARFAIQVDTVADILALGDWHINLTTGVISVWSSGAIGATDYELTYSHYASAPTSVSKFASAVGNLKAGDFLLCDANSNFAVASTEDFKDIMGQVLEVENVLDKDALARVRTAYDSLSTDAAGSLPAYAGQMDQMPGSATGGVSDKVHYAGAANLVVRVNLVSR